MPRVSTRGLHHYAISVADLERSIAWYAEMLGFEFERRFSPGTGTDIAHLIDANGVRIELLRRFESTVGPDLEVDAFDAILVQGAKHVGFLVDDIYEVWEKLSSNGAERLSPPTDVPPAGVRNCWFRDPDGTQIEFNEWLPLTTS